jgi:hypothetical protein
LIVITLFSYSTAIKQNLARENIMSTLLKPSALLPKGMQIQQINHLTLFKFTDELGDRLQTLLDKKKADSLTATENLELEAIAELDEIFSYINAAIAVNSNAHT